MSISKKRKIIKAKLNLQDSKLSLNCSETILHSASKRVRKSFQFLARAIFK